jgi:hypothetical protein
MDTGWIVLIVAAIALILYLVLKKPAPPPPPKATAMTELSGLISGVASIANLF